MYDGRSVGVVVPAYNEAGRVDEVIETMPGYVDRIYAVDDASTDETWADLRDCAQRVNGRAAESSPERGAGPPRVITIQHERNRGAGAAVKTGYSRALDDGVDVIAVMDGDGQMDPAHLERIVAPVAAGEVTYAKGNRLSSRRDYERMSRWRLFGNVVLTLLTRVSSGYWEVSDPQNGFTAISNEGLRRVRFERLYDEYGFLNHLLFALNLGREEIADVSHPSVYGDETSTIRYSTFIPRLSALLARNFVERIGRSYVLRQFHPLVVCYALGAAVTLTGIFGGAYTLASASVDAFLGGMLSVTVGAIGGLLLTLGMWFDVSENDDLVRSVPEPREPVRPEPGVDADPEIGRDQRFPVFQDGGEVTRPTEGESE
ncbi:glycosyltransferase family 2 protein [Halorubrum halophilum]|uniref:glycosyltransferase family 2 protein n=1 Tax=Halorubrum halophilum TaxID=413816 RepID=UPI000679793D|nr:glycosyltransferase family 2 protein [Halorubrum halophilum]